jgi:hypothetical protein
MGYPIAALGMSDVATRAKRHSPPLMLATEDFELHCMLAGIKPEDEGRAFAEWLNDIAGEADFDGGSY